MQSPRAAAAARRRRLISALRLPTAAPLSHRAHGPDDDDAQRDPGQREAVGVARAVRGDDDQPAGDGDGADHVRTFRGLPGGSATGGQSRSTAYFAAEMDTFLRV